MSTSEQTHRRAHRSPLATLTVFTLGPIFFLLLPQYVVGLVEDVGVSDAAAANLASIGAAPVSIAALYWIRRVDLRWTIGVGTALSILSNLISMAVTEAYAMLSTVRLVSGFGAIYLTVIAIALLDALSSVSGDAST